MSILINIQFYHILLLLQYSINKGFICGINNVDNLITILDTKLSFKEQMYSIKSMSAATVVGGILGRWDK